MFGPSLSHIVYQLNIDQQLRLVSLFKEFENEGTSKNEDEEYDIRYVIDDIENSIEFDIERKLAEEAASAGKSTIPEENWGVHETHCCNKHGCKYGQIDCPVILDLIKQQYPCEDCSYIHERTNI